MKQMICLSESKWSMNPERTQRLMMLLGEEVEVLFFELSVTKSPLKSWLRRTAEHMRAAAANVTVCRVPPACFDKAHAARLSIRWSIRHIARCISRRMREKGFENAVIWTDTPLTAALLEHIPHQQVIYDCHRSWDRYPTKMESELAYRADVVFAASPNLFDHVSPCNDSVYLLENGVDYALFAQVCMRNIEEEPVMTDLPRPVFTYLGNMTKSVRLGPLVFTARQHPDWTFVVAGRVSSQNPDYAALTECKNIRCIGYRPLSSQPACLAASDACFDLLHNDITDEDVIPERIYAYFAAELPVAAMYPVRSELEYPDVIYGAQSEVDFEYACLCASSEGDRSKPERRRRYAEEADWTVRGEALRRILHDSGVLL